MRHALPFTLTLVMLLWAPVSARAEVLTAADVVAIDRAADGTSVTFEGEAVGEDLRADGGHRWVNLLSGGTAVGVFMTDADAGRITAYGDYKQTGETVRVTGSLNIACDEHGGEFDVHAEEVRVVAPGSAIGHDPEPWKGLFGIAAASAGIFLWWYPGRMRERKAD